MKHLTRIGLLLIASLMAACQGELSGSERAHLTTVDSAFQNLMSVKSYYTDTQIILDQDIGLQGLSVNMVMTYDIQGTGRMENGIVKELDMDAVLDSEAGGLGAAAIPSSSVSMDMVLVNDDFFARVNSSSGPFDGTPVGRWVNAYDVGLGGVPAQTWRDMFAINGQFPFSFNQRTVNGVDRRADEVIDGVTMRVYALDMNAQEVLTSSDAIMSQLTGSIAGSDPSTAAFVQDFFDDYVSGSEIDVVVWVDMDANIIRKMQMFLEYAGQVSFQGMTMDIDQSATYNYDYSQFDRPVRIVAPPMGS